MKKTFKRILSVLLVAVMLVGVAPVVKSNVKATDYSENLMLEDFKEYQNISDDLIVDYVYDDFDNDTNHEMYILVGYVEDNYTFAELYFVGCMGVEIICDYDYYIKNESRFLCVKTICNRKFIMIDRTSGNNVITDIFTVTNGCSIEANISNPDLCEKRKFDENALSATSTCFDGHTSLEGEFASRTNKQYYFFWDEDKERFIEYGGIFVTRDQVSKIKGMNAYFKRIDELNYSIQDIIYRQNGILNINCRIKDEYGYSNENINFKYNYYNKSFELIDNSYSNNNDLLNSSLGGIYETAVTFDACNPKEFLEIKDCYKIDNDDNKKMYWEVFEQYLGLMTLYENNISAKFLYSRYEFSRCNEFICSSVYDAMIYSNDYKIWYSFCDIDDNGIDELIVSSNENDLSEVYNNDKGSIINAIYTYHNGKIYLLAEASYRTQMRIQKNKTISQAGSGGADIHGWSFLCISDNKRNLNILCDVQHIVNGDKSVSYYKNDEIVSYDEFNSVFVHYTGTDFDNYNSSEVVDLHWRILTDIALNQESILAFADDPALCVEAGDSMNLRFALTKDGGETIYEGWSQPALTIGDKSVISVSSMTSENSVYGVSIKGLKVGSSSLVITDTKTGKSLPLTITVMDRYSKNRIYAIDKMPEFYPDNEFEKDKKTNIYNQHGIYVNNYSAKYNSKTGGYDVSFTAYNSQYVTGAVDVYDKDGNWIRCKEIKRKSNISSLKDTAVQGFYLVTDFATGKRFTYDQHSFSEESEISFEVPKDGYFTISNNFRDSFGTFLYNSSEILLNGLKTVVGDAIDLNKDDCKIDVAKLVAEAAKEKNLSEEMDELADSTLAKLIDKISGKYVSVGVDQLCKEYSDTLLEILDALEIDFKDAVSVTFGVGESKLLKAFGPAGTVLKSCFSFSELSETVTQVEEIAKSVNVDYTKVVTSLDNGYVNDNGISVITNGNIDKEAILQTFRVSSSDIVEAILDPQNPYEQYELYNICFVKDDQYVQPSGKVTVKIPVPDNMKGNSCKVYRQEKNGKWTVLQAYRSGDYLCFETDHFSFYALVYDIVEPEIVNLPNKLDYVIGEKIDLSGLKLKLNGKEISSGFMCKESLAYKVGKQTVTVLYGDSELEFDINVKSPSVKSVSINDISLNYKKSTTLKPTITADEGAEYTVKYSSSNTKVATVDNNGKVTATKRGSGSATITCTVTDSNGNTVTDTCKVSVKLSFGQILITYILFGWIWY